MTTPDPKSPLPDDVEKSLSNVACGVTDYSDCTVLRAHVSSLYETIAALQAEKMQWYHNATNNAAELLAAESELFGANNKIAALEAENKRLVEALQKIATTEYRIYDGGRPYTSEHSSGYALGVADGHRLAAKWAEEALAQMGEKSCQKCDGAGYDHGIGEGLRLQDIPCQQCSGTGKVGERCLQR